MTKYTLQISIHEVVKTHSNKQGLKNGMRLSQVILSHLLDDALLTLLLKIKKVKAKS